MLPKPNLLKWKAELMEQLLHAKNVQRQSTPHFANPPHAGVVRQIVHMLEAENLSGTEVTRLLSEVKQQFNSQRDMCTKIVTPEELNALLGLT